MALPNFVKAFLASDYGRHTLLVVSLVVVMFLTAFFTGLFAHRQASAFLCQYDPESLSNCAKILELTDLSGPLNASSAGPKPADPANANQSSPQPGDNLNANTAAANSRGLETPNQNAVAPVSKNSTQPPEKVPELDTPQKDRLAGQAVQVKNLVRHHGKVMALFYEAYYQALSVILLMGVVAAVALFSIAQEGWTNANQYVKRLFVVATAGVAFFGLWPPVFEQEKNISDNKALFLEYKRLGNEIASYPATRCNVKHESTEPNAFINYVDSEMSRLGNVAIGFDYTKISYKGAFELNPNPPQSPTPPPTKGKKGEK